MLTIPMLNTHEVYTLIRAFNSSCLQTLTLLFGVYYVVCRRHSKTCSGRPNPQLCRRCVDAQNTPHEYGAR